MLLFIAVVIDELNYHRQIIKSFMHLLLFKWFYLYCLELHNIKLHQMSKLLYDGHNLDVI